MLKHEMISREPTEEQEEFKRYLDLDLPRLIIPNNLDLIECVSRCLQLFHSQFNTPYLNAGFSMHFPLIIAAYIENVMSYYDIQTKKQHDIPKLLMMKLPQNIIDDMEADFYWCFSISFHAMKVSL